jgi:hypothetical protein
MGAYGNPGGSYCDGTTSGLTTAQLIAQSLANWGGTLRVGRVGRSVVMIAPAAVPCIISRLPGGGAAKELSVISDVNICAMPAAYLKNGRINNVLLGQTITLALNIGLTSPSILGGFVLQGGVLATAKPDGGCGSNSPKQRVCVYDPITHQLIQVINEYRYRTIDPAVVAAIVGPKTVQGLLNLADSALANADGVVGYENGVALADISDAAAHINEAFDECMIFIGWDVPPCPATNGPTPSGRMNQPVTTVAPTPVKDLTAIAYPNPYTDRFSLRILSPVSGMAQIQFYNLTGVRVHVMRQFVQANVEQIVYYTGPTLSRTLLFKVQVGDFNAKGFALKPE